MKRCPRCKEEKSRSDFVRDHRRRDGLFPWCRPCHVEYQGKERKDQREDAELIGRGCDVCDVPLRGKSNRRYCSAYCKERAKRWRDQYSLTIQQYRALLADAGVHCPICGEVPRKWCIDHDHKTRKVTGLVCDICNIGLLMTSKHDRSRVVALLNYLDHPPAERIGICVLAPEKRQPSKLDRVWHR